MSDEVFCFGVYVDQLRKNLISECEDLTDEDEIREYIENDIERECIYTATCYEILSDLVICDWSNLDQEFGPITSISTLAYYALREAVFDEIDIDSIVQVYEEKQERLEEIEERLEEIDSELDALNCDLEDLKSSFDEDGITEDDQEEIDEMSQQVQDLLVEKNELIYEKQNLENDN